MIACCCYGFALLPLRSKLILPLISVLVRNWQPPIPTKGACCNLHSWRGLATLVLTEINQAHHTFNRLALETHRQDFLKAAIILSICF